DAGPPRLGSTAGALGRPRRHDRDPGPLHRRGTLGAIPARRSLLAADGPDRRHAARRGRRPEPHLLGWVRAPRGPPAGSRREPRGARARAPARLRDPAAARCARADRAVLARARSPSDGAPPHASRPADAPERRTPRLTLQWLEGRRHVTSPG